MFDGWTPERVTVHEHDDDGLLVRSVETVESEWDATEQGWMLALALWEKDRCHVCGGDIAECWDGASEGAWVVPPPIRCHRGTAIATARKQYDTDANVQATQALVFWAERREGR